MLLKFLSRLCLVAAFVGVSATGAHASQVPAAPLAAPGVAAQQQQRVVAAPALSQVAARCRAIASSRACAALSGEFTAGIAGLGRTDGFAVPGQGPLLISGNKLLACAFVGLTEFGKSLAGGKTWQVSAVIGGIAFVGCLAAAEALIEDE